MSGSDVKDRAASGDTGTAVVHCDVRVNSRRMFLQRSLIGAGAFVGGATLLNVWPRTAHAHSHDALQEGVAPAPAAQPGAEWQSTAGVINMDGEFYKATRRPPKPDAKPQLSGQQVDDLERRLSCPCPCNLNIFVCRTTDFACGNSPAVHRDIQALVAGGYNADEIMDAMIGTYGNNILMAPPKEGVNLVAWFGPFVAMGIGAVLINTVLRTWRRNAKAAAASAPVVSAVSTRAIDLNASDAELERLKRALRDEGNS
jgi:cytochrome c-type biogenesis protein CcmH